MVILILKKERNLFTQLASSVSQTVRAGGCLLRKVGLGPEAVGIPPSHFVQEKCSFFKPSFYW